MIKYPLYFEVKANGASGMATPFEASAENFPPIAGSVPKEFMGPGTGYSPEDLFSISVITCLIATFKVFAERAKLEFTDISATAKLTVDRGSAGTPELQKLDIAFTLSGVQDQETAKKMLAESEKYCLVSNAVKCEKSFTYNFA
ncbi:MAG: OsmC family protein [Simkaniaceae bacterium]|nr:OsmC family protein [Candidatus Sacchlamyda saccharinae]